MICAALNELYGIQNCPQMGIPSKIKGFDSFWVELDTWFWCLYMAKFSTLVRGVKNTLSLQLWRSRKSPRSISVK